MPTLEELLRNYNNPSPASTNPLTSPGSAALNREWDLGGVARTLLSDPIGVAKGPLSLGWDMVKGVGSHAANVVQAFLPSDVRMPGSTEAPDTLAKRAGLVANSALLGIPDYIHNTYQAQDQNITKTLGTLLYDTLPIEEGNQILTGRDEQGRPLTAEQLSRASIQGALEMLPAAKGAFALRGRLLKGVSPYPPQRSIYQTKEFQKAIQTLPAEQQGEAWLRATQAAAAEGTVEEGMARTAIDLPMTIPEQRASVAAIAGEHAINTTVAAKIVEKGLDAPTTVRLLDGVQQGIEEGFLRPEHLPQYAQRFGVPLEEVADHITTALTDHVAQASTAGKVLGLYKTFNFGVIKKEIESLKKAAEGNPELINRLNRMMADLGPTSVYQNAADLYRKWLRVARSSAVAQSATAVRNVISQGATGGMQIFEDVVAGSLGLGWDATKKLVGKATETKPLNHYYNDLMSDWASVMGASAKGTKRLTDLLKMNTPEKVAKWAQWWDDRIGSLDEMVFEQARLLGNTAGELVTRGKLKGAKNLPADWTERYADLITTPNRFQEEMLRKMFYAGRLDSNLKRLGMSWEKFDEGIKSGAGMKGAFGKELSKDVEFAVTDAVDHALKQTFSFSPTDGLGKAILNVYKEVPFLAGLGPYFPRFLINQYRYLLVDHNPLNILKIADPEFRHQLSKALAGDMRDADAMRVVGRALTGGAMAAAAWSVRQLPQSDNLKYYQLNTGEVDKEGNPIIADLRPFQPFTSYLFYADTIKAYQEGKVWPDNLTSAELIDAFAGIRNVADVPLFGFADIVRTADSSNPDALPERLARVFGQAASMPFIPLRTIEDLGSAAGIPHMGEQKDIAGDQFGGAIVNNIPGMRNILPTLPDALTGEPKLPDQGLIPGLGQVPGGLARQATGVSYTSVSPIEQALNQYGFKVGDMIGQYNDPEANRLVRKYFGKIANLEAGETGKVFQKMVGSITSAPFQDSLKRDLLRETFGEIRKEAYQLALQENPGVFQKHILSSQKEFIRELIGGGANR